MQSDLRILVVEPDPDRAAQIVEALSKDWRDVTVLDRTTGLARAVERLAPDIVLIDLAHPDRDTLEHLSAVSDPRARTVAMFVDQTDDELTRAAMAAGVSAYVVDGLKMSRIKPVLETAIARFQVMRQMQSELDAAKRALEDRKTIDRAKGILMRQRGLSEDAAYSLMRKTAMSQNRKVIDVAQALVTAADLLS